MKAGELLLRVRDLEGKIGVWNHLRERLANDLLPDTSGPSAVKISGVEEDHVVEVADSLDETVDKLQKELNKLLNREVKG